MGSHSVTCYLTQVNTPRLNPSHAGRYSIYLPGRDGRLSWPSWLDSAPAGSRTCDLSITSPTLNECNDQETLVRSRRSHKHYSHETQAPCYTTWNIVIYVTAMIIVNIYCCCYCWRLKVKQYSSPEQVISELWGVTCHMGPQCYLPPDTSEHAPLNPSQTGQYLI